MTAEHAAGVGGEVVDLAAIEVLAEAIAASNGWTNWTPHEFRQAEHVLASGAITTRATAADTVLATASRICCGENPAPHHAATDTHSQRMAFAEELARAVRGS